HGAEPSAGTELPRRHPEALAELLPKVILGIESAAARDLRDAHVAAFEEARRLAQAFFFEEVAEQASGDAMEAAGDVLARVAELFGDCFNRQLFVVADAPADGRDQGAK